MSASLSLACVSVYLFPLETQESHRGMRLFLCTSEPVQEPMVLKVHNLQVVQLSWLCSFFSVLEQETNTRCREGPARRDDEVR